MLDDIFGGGSSEPELLMPKWARKASKELTEAALPKAKERIARAGEAYPGGLTAPLSEYEQTGLGILGNYLTSPMPTETPLYTAAESELAKTLAGEEYDPVEGAYYQAYRNQVMRELKEAKERLAAATSASDKYFGGGRIEQTAELESKAMEDLATILGQLYETERARRLEAITPAMQMTTFGELAPVQRVEAAETYGALPRYIEQAGLSAEYQEWIRQLQDLGIPLETAMGLALHPYEYTVEEPSTAIGDIASALATIYASGA